MPGCTCAQTKTLSDYDLENIKDRVEPGFTRDNVEDWLTCNAGDFSCVTDFSASLEVGNETIDIPWQSEESEFAYSDCMFPCED